MKHPRRIHMNDYLTPEDKGYAGELHAWKQRQPSALQVLATAIAAIFVCGVISIVIAGFFAEAKAHDPGYEVFTKHGGWQEPDGTFDSYCYAAAIEANSKYPGWVPPWGLPPARTPWTPQDYCKNQRVADLVLGTATGAVVQGTVTQPVTGRQQRVWCSYPEGIPAGHYCILALEADADISALSLGDLWNYWPVAEAFCAENDPRITP